MSKKYLDDNGVLYLWNKIKSIFVAKEDGKGLSTNDYTTAEKNKLAGIATGANKTVVDSALSSTSTNPVQNKVINSQITTLTSASHTHSNKDVLDGITSDDYTNWQSAKNKAHTHSNKDVLDDITSTDVLSWNTSYLQTHEHENKTVLDGITAIDTALSSTSTNPVQNKVVKTEFGKYLPLTGGTLTGTLTGTTFIGGLSGNAASATKLQYERNINGLSFNGTADRVNYASCSTAAATAAKEVSCAGFALVTGAEITVKFTVTNTASSPTLNVGGTGAKPIYYRGSAISAGYLAANRTYTFRYNGTQYDLVGDIDTNTTYSAATTSKAGLMSAADKTKLDGIATGANKITVDSSLDSESTNPVQNKVIAAALNGKVSSASVGKANGIATLDSNGLVPSSQLPSYVDDVIEGYYYNSKFYKESAHTTEITGETGKIYVDLSTNNSYRYSGSTFVLITSSDMVAITNAEIDTLCV